MTTGLLEPTGEHALIGQPNSYGMVLGERLDVRSDYGLSEVQRAVAVKDDWFVYGVPIGGREVWVPPRPDFYLFGSLSQDRILDFWEATEGYMDSGIARRAARAAQDLARSHDDGRVTLFETSMFDWEHDPGVPVFAEQLRGLLGANEVLRDDTINPDDPLARYGTKIHLAFSGAVPLFLVERSWLSYDDYGRESLVRLVEIVQTFDNQTVTSMAHQLSLPEAMRVRELTMRWGATDQQRQYVYEHADRSIGRRGRAVADRDIKRLMEQTGQETKRSVWRRAARGMLDLLADTRAVMRLDGVFSRERGRHSL